LAGEDKEFKIVLSKESLRALKIIQYECYFQKQAELGNHVSAKIVMRFIRLAFPDQEESQLSPEEIAEIQKRNFIIKATIEKFTCYDFDFKVRGKLWGDFRDYKPDFLLGDRRSLSEMITETINSCEPIITKHINRESLAIHLFSAMYDYWETFPRTKIKRSLLTNYKIKAITAFILMQAGFPTTNKKEPTIHYLSNSVGHMLKETIAKKKAEYK